MPTEKKNIAVIAGGYSGEHQISLASAETILNALDGSRYIPYLIVWSDSKTSGEHEVKLHHNGTTYDVDLNDFSVTLPEGTLFFHYAFIAIHGTPGEDGKLQGYLDMQKIPYSTGGLLAMALTFHKEKLKEMVRGFEIPVPKGLYLRGDIEETDLFLTLETKQLATPLFVKPCQGGSSIATTKVEEDELLLQAIRLAAHEDLEGYALVEEAIEGTEVTCGMLRLQEKTFPLAITEVVTYGTSFFDFEAKYSGKTDEITPARIAPQIASIIETYTRKLGEILDLKGLYRADFIIPHTNNPVLLEVNTVPGFTLESFIPKQIRAAGLEMTTLLTAIIEENPALIQSGK